MKQITLAAMALVALTVTGCVNRDEQKTAKETAKIVSDPLIAVSVQSAQTRPLSESVEVTGSIDVGDTTAVGARISGRIVSVFVQEGSVVKEGQILAVQDTSQLQTQLSQALANLRSAEAQLQQQIKNASMTPDRTSAQIRTAEAALRQARVNLQKAINGPRGQEIEQAEATLRSADENLKTQKLELERVQKLVSEGAVAANRLDSQRNQVAAAQAQFDGAKQSVNLLREGTRKEDIQALREAVSQAESSVRSSKVQRDLDSLLLDQVRSSKAQVDAARASVQQIQQQIGDATVKAPFAGTITGKPTQAGSVLAPGGKVVDLVGQSKPYFTAQVPEQVIPKLISGATVTITIDALGAKFPGRVESVNPLGSEFGRQFSVRVAFDAATASLRPGMFARGSVLLRSIPSATVVPDSAVVKRDGKDVVFTIRDSAAEQVSVTRGLRQGELVQVSGVLPGTEVVIRGQEALDNGTKVKVQAGTEAKPGETKEVTEETKA